MAEIEPLDHYTKAEAKAIIDEVRDELNEKIDNIIIASPESEKPSASQTKLWLRIDETTEKE